MLCHNDVLTSVSSFGGAVPEGSEPDPATLRRAQLRRYCRYARD